MNRSFFLAAVLLLAPQQASADAFNDIMKRKVIKIAVPQDFAPFGSAGPDLKPMGKNPEREKVIDFSKVYAPFFPGVFGLKDAKIEKPEDLAGKTVGSTRGAIEEQEITKLAPFCFGSWHA